MNDIKKKRLSEFEAQIRNEKPEEEQNPVLIKELATIRFNYYLTTFKEIFNDVIEERRQIIKEQRTGLSAERDELMKQVGMPLNKMKTEDLFKSKS